MTDPAWVALSLAPRIGRQTLQALLDHFGDLAGVLGAGPDALQAVPGVGPRTAAYIRSINTQRTAQEMLEWGRSGVRALAWGADDYPAPLAALSDAPPTLFVRGCWGADLWQRAAAVVGTRRPSGPATTAAYELGRRLAEQGLTVVSGLARGVDTLAHRGALAGGEAAALAVLGCGVLRPYPPENRQLAAVIMQRGALLSEVHPLAGVKAPWLVARNRLISGLAGTLFVVETGPEGGAMHAARRAFVQGRPVYVLDLPAAGNRALLADGAQPIAPTLDDLPAPG